MRIDSAFTGRSLEVGTEQVRVFRGIFTAEASISVLSRLHGARMLGAFALGKPLHEPELLLDFDSARTHPPDRRDRICW